MEKNELEALSPETVTCIKDTSRVLGLLGNIQLDVQPATGAAENYLGVVYKVKVTGKSAEDKEKQKIVVHFFLKTMHTDERAKETLQNAAVFASEIKFYSQILPAFEGFRRRYGGARDDLLDFVPKCYATMSDGKRDFILLEDLKELGFEMKDRLRGMDRNECLLAMRAIGKMHAFSYAMMEKEQETFSELVKGIKHPFFVPEKRNMNYEMFQKIGNNVLEAVCVHSPSSAVLLERLVAKGFFDIITEICERKEPMSVLIHGDVWMNNVLFRGSPAKEIILVDYQLLQYHSPAIDLLYTLFSAVKKPIRDEFYEEFLTEYHQTLRSSLRSLQARDDVLSLETLKVHMKKYAMYGLGLCILLIPIFYGKITEEIVFVGEGDALSNMVSNHTTYMKELEIQIQMTELVDDFVHMGYLEA